MLISCIKLDHALYSINYSMFDGVGMLLLMEQIALDSFIISM